MPLFLKISKVYQIVLVSIMWFSFPYTLFAQSVSTSWFDTLISEFGTLMRSAIPVFIALAFFVFLWGVVVFISASGDESRIGEGRQKMMWGVIALFVITAIWGILSVLRVLTGVGNETSSSYPGWR